MIPELFGFSRFSLVHPARAKLSLFRSLPANTQSQPPRLPDSCCAPFSSFINHNKCPDNVTEGTFRFLPSFSTLIYFVCGGCNNGFPAGQIHDRGQQLQLHRRDLSKQSEVSGACAAERASTHMMFESKQLVVTRNCTQPSEETRPYIEHAVNLPQNT